MTSIKVRVLCIVGAVLLYAGAAAGQGVTTASITGVVKDSQGAVVPGTTITAVHQPSGTTYEATTQADGRYVIPGMRVGGPYTLSATLSGFATEVHNGVTLQLGVAEDQNFSLKVAAVSESVTVVAEVQPVFSSSRTGAATAVTRDDLATLPTITGRIIDVTRTSPQFGGYGGFGGMDNRASNITVDGSYFNGAFGLDTTTGGPGDRTRVAPISLESIEQVQISVAPYDVRQGNFTGANINSVTRSGTNTYSGSFYSRYRNESFVGTEAAGQPFNPGKFTTKVNGGWAGGPIIKNKLFFFASFEKQEDTRPLITFLSNPGGAPVTGNTTRVLTSDLAGLSSFLLKNFNYDTGPFDNIPQVTPAKPWMIKGDYNISSSQKVTFRYNQLDSSTDVLQSGSSSLGSTRPTNTSNYLSFANSNYKILENIKSGVGEWNAVWGTLTNSLIVGHTYNDESRAPVQLFPFVQINDGAGTPYTAFGTEPFTPSNQLYYKQFQAQDSVTKFLNKHSVTFGGALERFHSDNSFYYGFQSAYTYNNLADFYTDANSLLANPNRTVSPVLSRFQVRYALQPGQTTLPIQPLTAWYYSGYLQDEWRPRTNVTVTAGLRVDVPRFEQTFIDNPNADALTFRDQDGSTVKYNTGAMPQTTAYWSPRLGLNWDPWSDGNTQVRGGTGLFTGKPPYVWISNQVNGTGMLTGFFDTTVAVNSFPFNPDPNKYKPVPAGGPAASYELDVIDQGYRFPQTWRTNVGADRKLPWWGLIGTADFIYNQDINAPVYINSNLPAANSAFTGPDGRPRWVVTATLPACVPTGQAGACINRLNNAVGNQVTGAYILKDQNRNYSWTASATLAKTTSHGFGFKGGWSYNVSKSLVEPSSSLPGNYTGNQVAIDPNNPPLANSINAFGARGFAQVSYSKDYFGWGATTVSAFWEVRHNVPVGFFGANFSYVFAGDANGDGVSGNDLIYIPRDTSEMNFKPLTVSGKTFTAADQSAAFEQYIQNDPYLSSHRGQYAERGGEFFPMVNRIDLSISQDLFHKFLGAKHSAQVRLDITNFGNLLNHSWGVGQRVINNQLLTNPSVDAQGRLTYNLQTLSGNLLTSPFITSAALNTYGNDVYVMMISFRYTFN